MICQKGVHEKFSKVPETLVEKHGKMEIRTMLKLLDFKENRLSL